MSFHLTILGCHSATPRSQAYPSSQHLEMNGESVLIDCGEGTQSLLRKYKVRFSKISHVFISHLHGDHFFGLIGLLSTFSLLNRKSELHVYGPKGLKDIITLQLKLSKSWIEYPLYFHELKSNDSELILENEKLEVHTVPLKHRIYTNGFVFKEKSMLRKLDMKQVSRHPEIEVCDYRNIKLGKDFVRPDGTRIDNRELTLDPPKPLSYAYCSDTAYSEEVVGHVKGVDLLYHESTFLEKHRHLAEKTGHSTAMDAARIASMAEVRQLILGHFSSRYDDLEQYLEEAGKVFDRTGLCESGAVFSMENPSC